MPDKTTLSVIKADVGSVAGHQAVHPRLEEIAQESLEKAQEMGVLRDFYVTHCGDDLELVMTHRLGVDNPKVHELAWLTFQKAAKEAEDLHLYAAGQDLLVDAFAGNVRGLGPGSAELEFQERRAEPVAVFMMDKTEPGTFNFPIFRMFGDPFCSAGLVIDTAMHEGFRFEVWDIKAHRRVFFACPEEMHDLLAFIGTKGQYVIKRVYPRADQVKEGEAVACVSTDKLAHIAGKYVGKDDPVAIVRSQSGLPAMGEILEAWAWPFLAAGWNRGSHNGPVLPITMAQNRVSRFDGPPRVFGLGFQVGDGELVGPVDLFDDPAFDPVRQQAAEVADYMRRHGPFEPHRLPMDEMEYTTMPALMAKVKDRWEEVA
ncbi:MAG: fructose-1,6-bisphosphate aldolase/phosphatase [Thermoplasmata archaeon]